VDNSSGTITGTGITGTIDYNTGALSVTFTAAPANAAAILAQYRFSSEVNGTSIRKVNFDLSLVPVKADLYPVGVDYSVAAQLAAQSHLAIDVQQTLTDLAVTAVKIERDNRLINEIKGAATADTSINFNADMTSVQYDKRTKYGEIELKLSEAVSNIQGALGRGGVDYVLCGQNAANVFQQSRGFRPEAITAPIGSHKIGTLNDGTVSVIKVVNGPLGTNDYVFGFKGYMTGDASIVLAEWIPAYFTPWFQSPELINKQGILSGYALVRNTTQYLRKGTLTNYTA
jgi:hypothetical protein